MHLPVRLRSEEIESNPLYISAAKHADLRAIKADSERQRTKRRVTKLIAANTVATKKSA